MPATSGVFVDLTTFRRAALALLAMLAVVPFFAPAQAAETRPPLVVAIDHSDPAMFRQALQSGGDVNAVYERETMLTYAIRTKRWDMAKLILQTPGVDVNKRGTNANDMVWWTRTPLILAAGLGQADIVSTLLKMGAAVNAKDASDNTPEARGSTALIKAAQGDNAEVIRVLVTEAKGIDVNAKNRNGMPALWFVAEAEDLAAVKLLREHGAAVNIANAEGKSVVTTTFRHKRYAVVDYLVAQGADINRVDSHGLTPLVELILSLKSDDRKTLYAFLEHFLTYKPNLDLQKSLPGGLGGEPALHLAAQFGHADAVALLLDHGANVNLKNQTRGATALHIAVYANQPEVAKVLIAHKANLEATEMSGATPLTMATQLRKQELVKILTEAGAAPAKVKTYGPAPAQTPSAADLTKPSAVPVEKLYGTWTGSQDGVDYAVMTLTLNKAGTYSFTSKFTAAALKKYPKGTPPVIAAHQGSYTITGNSLILNPTTAPPTTLQWVLENGVLIFDGRTRMKKGK
jgi:ankyrin repeat protein